MLKKRLTKVAESLRSFLKGSKNKKKSLLCKECDTVTVEVAQDIKAVTCAYCVQRQVEPPPSTVKVPEGEKFPRGWALKARYVHTDGRIFVKGKATGEVETAEPPKPKKTKKTVAKKVTKKKTPKKKRK